MFNEEEFRDKICNLLVEGGYSSIRNLIDNLSIEVLKEIYEDSFNLDDDDE